MSGERSLYAKLELRAITNSDLKRDSAVMMSSTMPSAKYSCSGSPLMFWKGRTAIEGLSGRASCSTDDGCLCSYEDSSDRDDGRRQSDGSHFTLKACTGRSMFFRARLPRSAKVALSRPMTAS